jgi:hypothetical protein
MTPAITPDVVYARLVDRPDEADLTLAGLDAGDERTRREVLDAMRRLAINFIQPARELLSHDAGHASYDLTAIAGGAVSGLVLGLLAAEYRALQVPPAAPSLATSFDSLGVEMEGEERQARFFQAWMAQRTAHVVRRLVAFLSVARPSDSSAVASELDMVGEVADMDLPSVERDLLRALAAKLPSVR